MMRSRGPRRAGSIWTGVGASFSAAASFLPLPQAAPKSTQKASAQVRAFRFVFTIIRDSLLRTAGSRLRRDIESGRHHMRCGLPPVWIVHLPLRTRWLLLPYSEEL